MSRHSFAPCLSCAPALLSMPPTACRAPAPAPQGLNGIAQLVAALPAGFLADRYRRDTLLRAGALVGAAAGGLLAVALAWQPTVGMLAAASALLGCYSGTYNAALEALFADSVPPGRRWARTCRLVSAIAVALPSLAQNAAPLLGCSRGHSCQPTFQAWRH